MVERSNMSKVPGQRTETRERRGMNWRFVVRALRHRNYRLFYGGQGISLIGTWMTRVATGWLIYRLTDSAFLLGLVSFSGQIPILVLGPIAGVWVDRMGSPPGPCGNASTVDAAILRSGSDWRSPAPSLCWTSSCSTCFRV